MKKMTFLMFLAIGTFMSSCTNAQTPEQKAAAVINNVNTAEFAKIIKAENAQLIDVRTAGEYAGGNIAGSKLIDIKSSSFDDEISRLNKNEPVYVYCRSGARSMSAARIMEAQGFTKVYNLSGGYLSWSRSF